MICINCGQKQVTGNFCGKCGAPFSTNHLEVQTPTASVKEMTEPNPHIQNVKRTLKLYVNYFVHYFKTPSTIYRTGEKEFFNGMISLILFILLMTCSFFTLANNYPAGSFSTFGSFFFFSGTSVLLVLSALTLINHFFGPGHSFKSVISLYGGHLSLVICLGFISLLLILLKSFTFGSLLFIFNFLFTIFILPLYLISLLLTHKTSSGDPFYAFIVYLVTLSTLFAIVMTIFADSSIGNSFNHFKFWF